MEAGNIFFTFDGYVSSSEFFLYYRSKGESTLGQFSMSTTGKHMWSEHRDSFPT
jgi:hypothetical protein